MSLRLPSRCLQCGARHTNRGGYCDDHQNVTAERQAKKKKDEPWRKWYGWAIWARIKAAALAKYPERLGICQAVDEFTGRQCTRPATETDHIVPHRGDWLLFIGGMDYSNLQGLCHAHHSQKTAKEDGGFGHA